MYSNQKLILVFQHAEYVIIHEECIVEVCVCVCVGENIFTAGQFLPVPALKVFSGFFCHISRTIPPQVSRMLRACESVHCSVKMSFNSRHSNGKFSVGKN